MSMASLLLEEFAEPSIRRLSDAGKDEETEIDRLEQTIYRKAHGTDSAARPAGLTGTLWRRCGGLR